MSYPYSTNQYPYPYGSYGQSYHNNLMAQTQINRQQVSLLQDQNASNTIMCRILSEL